MRVIAGTARSIPLLSPVGMDTRPTTDRIKETLFNMIQNELYDCNFLDLFSGSGAIGIEALSRGAKKAVFVEKNRKALFCIYENLAKTKLDSKSTVLPMDFMQGLRKLEQSGECFDIIFMDPPYEKGIEEQVIQVLRHSSLIHKETIIIIESSLNTSVDYVYDMGYDIEKVKKYKTNQHVFLKTKE